MEKYIYQIYGILHNPDGNFHGVRIVVVGNNVTQMVDIKSGAFDADTRKYLEFRTKLSERLDFDKLPASVQYNVKMPIKRCLDLWMQEKLNGDTSEPKNTNA
jgi:hypothetical protein